MDYKKYLSNPKIIGVIILLGLLLLIIPYANRTTEQNNLLIGGTPYYNIRIAQAISSGQKTDNMVASNRPIFPDPYQYLLSLFVGVINLELISIILPLFFGLISLLLISLIIDKFNTDPLLKIIILIMTILSPIFIYTFSISSKYTLIITLFLLGTFFFLREKKYNLILSILALLPITLFGTFETFMILFILFIYVLLKKKKQTWFGIIFVILFIVATSNHLYIQNTLPKTTNIELISSTILTQTISDFGSEIGIGFFKILLACIGILVLWKDKKSNAWPIVLFFVMIISVLVLNYSYIIYTGLILAYFAAIGFYRLVTRKWEVDTLKYLTAITLLSGLLFSTVSYVHLISNAEPNPNQIAGMEWLKQYGKSGYVLSDNQNGFWIESFANVPVLLDDNPKFDPLIDEKYEDAQTIYHSRNIDTTKSLLEKNQISYIFIDEKMQKNIWKTKDDGLLFLVQNSETFKKVYSSSKIVIWEVINNDQIN